MIKQIIRFKEVASTQDTAKRFVDQKNELAISSLRQKRGRGRHGRTWFSPSGGLYVSLLLFPEVRVNSIPLLASLTIIKLLEDYGFSHLLIQWPNDVLLDRKKVSGIICERYRNAVICGIGLNINNNRFSRKLEKATSLRIAAGKTFDVDEILNHLVGKFNPLYTELQSDGIKVKEVLNYIDGIGESVEVITSKKIVKGTVYDIDGDWALMLRDESGMIKKFYYGDVRRLRW
jgi:BirA family biotin operon repressor/biotin-[acetyl-CoA-carboxylase] ligase